MYNCRGKGNVTLIKLNKIYYCVVSSDLIYIHEDKLLFTNHYETVCSFIIGVI